MSADKAQNTNAQADVRFLIGQVWPLEPLLLASVDAKKASEYLGIACDLAGREAIDADAIEEYSKAVQAELPAVQGLLLLPMQEGLGCSIDESVLENACRSEARVMDTAGLFLGIARRSQRVVQAAIDATEELHPAVAEDILSFRAYLEGLRSLVYQKSYYHACIAYDTKGKHKEMEVVADTLGLLIDAQLPRVLRRLLQLGIRIADQNQTQRKAQIQLLRTLEYALLNVGYADSASNAKFLRHLLRGKNFDYLLSTFETIFQTKPQSLDLQQALNIWHEHVSSLLLSIDRIKSENMQNADTRDMPLDRIFDRLSAYCGEVILGFQLLKQSLIAEGIGDELESETVSASEDSPEYALHALVGHKLGLTQFFMTKELVLQTDAGALLDSLSAY